MLCGLTNGQVKHGGIQLMATSSFSSKSQVSQGGSQKSHDDDDDDDDDDDRAHSATSQSKSRE